MSLLLVSALLSDISPRYLIITGPEETRAYLEDINRFIGDTLGKEAQARYELVINDPVTVARKMKAGMEAVRQYRRDNNDAYFFNWTLKIDHDFQVPFEPTHANMKTLRLTHDAPFHELAADLRRAFSGIVAGNVKADGVKLVRKHGPYEIHGDADILDGMDRLLRAMVDHGRMKISGKYDPCYRIVKS